MLKDSIQSEVSNREEKENDIFISCVGDNIDIFSTNQMDEVDLFDQCGRFVKTGKKISAHKFTISVNFRKFKFIALFLKISLLDGSVLKRLEFDL